PAKQARQSKSAAPEKKQTRRRGLGNYVGNKSKTGGRPSPKRRDEDEPVDEWVEEPVEAPPRKQRLLPPAPRPRLEGPGPIGDEESPSAGGAGGPVEPPGRKQRVQPPVSRRPVDEPRDAIEVVEAPAERYEPEAEPVAEVVESEYEPVEDVFEPEPEAE